MDIGIILLIFAAGILGGAMSAIAGGASFFTFPALLFAGLPPLIANVTNLVALAPSNISALPAFRSELKQLGRAIILPTLIGVIGGMIGAVALVTLGGGLFATAVPYLMGAATLLFAFAPKLQNFIQHFDHQGKNGNSVFALSLLFIFSVYGGYFGAGLGQIVLAALVLNGITDFHKANALKNVVVSGIGISGLFIYVFSGAVSWNHALILMLGAIIGGYLGGLISKKVQQNLLRLGVISLGAFLTVYYFLSGL